jgi:hypothetical protein
MPFRWSLADIELNPFVFHSQSSDDRAVRPIERPDISIPAHVDDENRLKNKSLGRPGNLGPPGSLLT